MRTVAFGLGANLGDPKAQIATAARTLSERLHGPRVSSLYRSAAVGGPLQPDFLNAVVVGATPLDVLALRGWIEELERAAGRARRERWGPRTLDVDLLLVGGETFDSEDFIVPHPRWRQRAFVLVPLIEVAPGLVDPHSGRSVEDIGDTLGADTLGTVSLDSTDWLETVPC